MPVRMCGCARVTVSPQLIGGLAGRPEIVLIIVYVH